MFFYCINVCFIWVDVYKEKNKTMQYESKHGMWESGVGVTPVCDARNVFVCVWNVWTFIKHKHMCTLRYISYQNNRCHGLAHISLRFPSVI